MKQQKNNSFIPNQTDIDKWDDFQDRTYKSFFAFRMILFFIAIIVTVFLLFLEHFKPLNMLYIFTTFLIFSFILFFNIRSLQKTMNKEHYFELESSLNDNNIPQCIFCGSTNLVYRVKGTHTTECRCKDCKSSLFSHLDLSKEYRKNIDY